MLENFSRAVIWDMKRERESNVLVVPIFESYLHYHARKMRGRVPSVWSSLPRYAILGLSEAAYLISSLPHHLKLATDDFRPLQVGTIIHDSLNDLKASTRVHESHQPGVA